MIARARSLLFDALFFGLSVVIVVLAPIAALFGRRAAIRYAHGWARMQGVLARWILGIRVRVEGTPPAEPALVAAKHQAMFETLELAFRLHGPIVVLKQELAQIPFWGGAARAYGVIAVDRSDNANALRRMLREARQARAEHRSVLIFPEGTRVAPGETPPLQSGFAGLYKALALPVVPVAVDSGRLWPRSGPKRPGVITLRFGAPIPPGLPRRDVEARVHAEINALEPNAAA